MIYVDHSRNRNYCQKRRVRWEIKMKMEIKIKGSARPYEWELDLFLCVRAVHEKRGTLAVPCHLDESPLVCYYPTRPKSRRKRRKTRAKLRGSCAPTGQGFLTRAKGDGNKIRTASTIMWITSSRTVLECQHSIEFPFFSLWETREDYRGTSEPLIESSRRTKRLGPHLYVDDLADYYLQDLMMLWTMRSSLFITCLFLCFVLLVFRNGSGRRRPVEIKKSADHFHRGAASRPSGQFFTGLESRRPRLGTHRQFNGPVEKGDSGVVPEHESAAQETPQHFKQFRLQ